MSRTQRTVILHFDKPIVIDEGDLLVDADGYCEVFVEPKVIEDFVDEQLAENDTYGESEGDEYLTTDGRPRRMPKDEGDTYVTVLLGGKDCYHGFEDYKAFLDNLPFAVGTQTAKFKAIQVAKEYYDDDDTGSAARDAIAECRAEIRAFAKRRS